MTVGGAADPRRSDTIAGAVLTGGASRRMGRDKALVDVEGRALAARVADVIRAAGIHDVVAIGGDVAALTDVGFVVVPDDHPGVGPLGGIATALRHVDGSASAVLVVACDLPRLDVETVSRIVRSWSETSKRGDADVVAASTGRLEPLCAVWSVDRCRGVTDRAIARGERSVHRVLDELTCRTVDVSPAALHNANRPDDLTDL